MAERCPACGHQLSRDTTLAWGGFILDETGRTLTIGKKYVDLAPNAMIIMGVLIRAQGRLVSKDALFGACYAHKPDADWPEMKIIDVFVCKIRAKSSALQECIKTSWGRGYYLVPLPEELHVAVVPTVEPDPYELKRASKP